MQPGEVRRSQNWIGGSDYSPRDALYVPPPPETVLEYLTDLLTEEGPRVFVVRKGYVVLALMAVAIGSNTVFLLPWQAANLARPAASTWASSGRA